MGKELIRSSTASVRISAANCWLSQRLCTEKILIIASSEDGVNDILRREALQRGALFGWYKMTLTRLAHTLAAPLLADQGWSMVGALGSEAMAWQAVDRMEGEQLGRYRAASAHPGFARALARAVAELRLAQIESSALAQIDIDLAHLLASYEQVAQTTKIADQATLFQLAIEAVKSTYGQPFLGLPLLLLDIAIRNASEYKLIQVLADASDNVLATVPLADEWSLSFLESALQVSAKTVTAQRPTNSLAGLGHQKCSTVNGPLL